MISQIFFLSSRGDILINRDFRSDLFKETPETFFRNIKQVQENHKPVFTYEGITYIFLNLESIYIVGTTRFNVQVSLILDYLRQIVNNIKDFCGSLSENIIRKNFVLVYEILDEMMDFGYPQLTNTEQLTQYIVTPVEQERMFFNFPTTNIFKSNTINAKATKDSITTASQKNAIFFDVIENLSIIFDSSDKVISQILEGQIQVKSYLSGFSQLELEFNDISNLADLMFHECVDQENLNTQQKLKITPKVGEFILMNYRIDSQFDIPFYVTPYIKQENQYKIEFEINLRCLIEEKLDAKIITIKFNVPDQVSSVRPEIDKKDKNKQAQYIQDNKEVIWIIQQMKGQQEHKLITKITLSEEIGTYQLRKQMGPIKISYEITTTNLSHLKIQQLNILETEKEKPDKWVRYLNTSDSFIVRI